MLAEIKTVCFVKPDQWGRYGLLLRPLQANAFMCSIEETLEHEGKMLTYYRARRHVDGTLTVMLITSLIETLNHCHSSVKFTMETEKSGMLPFLSTQLSN